MLPQPFLRARLALLLTAGLLSACETATPPAAGSTATQQTVASAAPSATPSATPSAVATARPAAKEPDRAISIGERHTFRSTVLGEDRAYLVYTPQSYKQSKTTYPVLYLLDGDAHFHHTTGIVRFLSDNGRAAEMIVVGVSNTDRTRDMTPTPNKDFPNSGGAAKLLTFLKEELRPRVEGAYRAAPYRVLIGHSFGGLFVINALTTAPDAFNAYVSLSPSLFWDGELMRRQAEELFGKRPDLQSFLYFTLGKEPGNMMDSNKSFEAMLKAKAPKGLTWSFKLMDRENHSTIPHRATYDALEALFLGWELPEKVVTLKALQAHYEGLSKRFSHEVKAPEAVLNAFGYRMMKDHRDEALAAFQLNVQLYPDSANVYDSLGELHEKSGKPDLARTNYEMAVRKATASADPSLPLFKTNLERLSKPK